jgi:hypothetical protein
MKFEFCHGGAMLAIEPETDTDAAVLDALIGHEAEVLDNGKFGDTGRRAMVIIFPKNENISERDNLWLTWIKEHGAGDSSIGRFLEENPPQ